MRGADKNLSAAQDENISELNFKRGCWTGRRVRKSETDRNPVFDENEGCIRMIISWAVRWLASVGNCRGPMMQFIRNVSILLLIIIE